MEQRSPSDGEGRASPLAPLEVPRSPPEPPAPRQVPELQRGGVPAVPEEPPAGGSAGGSARPSPSRDSGDSVARKGTQGRGSALEQRDPRDGRGEEEEEDACCPQRDEETGPQKISGPGDT